MFVPIVPLVHGTKIVNKNIVYSDTVLSLKEFGKNINVTTINNVSESSLESCLKIVFEANPNVVFNTVQYSKNHKKLYFYTNKKISTKEWDEINKIIYKPINGKEEILVELKNILTMEINKNSDCISLYDVASFMKQKNNEYDKLQQVIKKQIDSLIESKIGSSSSFVIHGFDYDKNELKISFKKFRDYDEIVFAKKDNDLYIKESSSLYAKDVLVAVGHILSKLYDMFIEYKDYKKQYSYGIHSINSAFLVDVSSYGISMFVRSKDKGNYFNKEFELDSRSYKEEYTYNCNSNDIIGTIKGYEDEIFKRVFIRIEDCPKWSREFLYEIRKKQLEREKKIEEELKKQEEKKQKRLELTRKLFPFLKR